MLEHLYIQREVNYFVINSEIMAHSTSVYVASSWRNEQYPEVVKRLRDAGFNVYDFRNPPSGDHGFWWDSIDPRL